MPTALPQLTITQENWPIAGSFTIARGSKTSAKVVVATVEDGGHTGRGECVPYPRYGETAAGVAETLEKLTAEIAGGLDRSRLQSTLPAGAARNALDCALWDLEAKQTGVPVWQRAELPEPKPLTTAYTISLDTPAAMGRAASQAAKYPLLKLKLGGPGDIERVEAVRQAAPNARLVVDANEGWAPDELGANIPALATLGVELIEAPLPADLDHLLVETTWPVPLCADESCHTAADIPRLAERYQFVNIKLDKAGGLTGAISLLKAAQARNLGIMVGCMVSTSLAMAPAFMLAGLADYTDLDGPLLLAQDRQPALTYRDSEVEPPAAELWG